MEICTKCNINIRRKQNQRWCLKCHSEYIKNYRKTHRKKITKEQKVKLNARSIVKMNLRRGNIIRPQMCSRCNNKTKIEAHHKNYNHPLDIEWICKKCHIEEHYKNKS